MKKLLIFILLTVQFSNIIVKAEESAPYKKNVEEIFNVGKMLSHNNEFTLFFKTRDKSILARGEDTNYITDYPQDLYLYNNDTEKIKPLITYDWFPKKAKSLLRNYRFPVFPEDYAYYLLKDNQTIIMINAVKSIDSNFKFNINTNKLETLKKKNRYNFIISSLLKGCEFKNMSSLYECEYYKPLISTNLIN